MRLFPSPPVSSPRMVMYLPIVGHWASGRGPWSSSASCLCRWSLPRWRHVSHWRAILTSGRRAWRIPRWAGSSAGFLSSF